MNNSEQKGNRLWSDKKVFIMIGLGLFLISCVILLIAVYLYLNTEKKVVTAPNDSNTVMVQVKRLMDLPNDESPQVIPINDLASFKDNLFFTRARVGDMLIVYIKNHVAILYATEERKIINMSKITIIIPRPAALPL